tara:strand:- start:4493 stop:5479 length:987 start_codon:yes stop_codon:yes gene_type:complete
MGSTPVLPTVRHEVAVSDGDRIILHEDKPPAWRTGQPAMLLIHGLTGCHAAPYMLRMAQRFFDQGVRVYRMDMRGSGAGMDAASQLTHAGRSDDVIAALGTVAKQTAARIADPAQESVSGQIAGPVAQAGAVAEAGPIWATGISLSANQLLRAAGRIGAGLQERPVWFDRIKRIAAVAPPLDLAQCSKNMNRLSRRFYNRYFIHWLLKRIPSQVRTRDDFQRALAGPRPRTLWQLDDRFTAPLSGFRDAADYYEQSSAIAVTRHNPIETLVLTAKDDPLVPIECFTEPGDIWPESTCLHVTPTGGHVGFINRHGRSWMDDALLSWFCA